MARGQLGIVGENGPELFAPGMSGSIIPNGAMGGVVITQNIDARGATTDLIKVLPGVLKSHGEQLESRIVEGIRRGRYDI
jgi:hypothetical protein